MKAEHRHVLTILRKILGLKQSAFAQLVGCSTATIQSIEPKNRRMALSEELAERIAMETGVDVGWLLTNDPQSPPRTASRKPYTRAHFEAQQSKLHAPKIDPDHFSFAQSRLVNYLDRLVELMTSAHNRDKLGLACYKLDAAFTAIEKDLGSAWEGKRRPTEREVPSEILKQMRRKVVRPLRLIFDKYNATLLLQFRRKHCIKGNLKDVAIAIQCLNGTRIRIQEINTPPVWKP